MPDYTADNRRWWDEVTPVHIEKYGDQFVGVDEFLAGQTSLDPLELAELGPVQGKRLLHLQSHFGLDTLSWAREGAKVTGLDFSGVAIKKARGLARQAGLEATFIETNVYEARPLLDPPYDIVYTSRGVLNWLHDLDVWAKLIADSLSPGGVFYLMELHPLLFVIDLDKQQRLELKYPYFHSRDALPGEPGEGDYADPLYIPKAPTWEWSWSLGDVVSALAGAGLRIEFLHEWPWLFYKAMPVMKEHQPGRWIIPGYEDKIPLTYTLKALRK